MRDRGGKLLDTSRDVFGSFDATKNKEGLMGVMCENLIELSGCNSFSLRLLGSILTDDQYLSFLLTTITHLYDDLLF